METSQRDALLGTITWWGFHALLIWMGAWHFLSRDLADGGLFVSDLFAGALLLATALSLLRLSVGLPPPSFRGSHRHLARRVSCMEWEGRMGQPDRCGHLGVHVFFLWSK